jgi:hypothetical protein
MKIFAQTGHQTGDKATSGLQNEVIEGVIYNARNYNPQKAAERIDEARRESNEAEILFDPEFYATRQSGAPNSQLGSLEDWEYFVSYRRRDLVRTQVVETVLQSVRDAVSGLDVTAHIAPNIYISQSFDSMEAGIALSFIERTKDVFEGADKPVYATLAVDRRALLSPGDFKSFINDLTGLENSPDGIYVLVGGGPINERSDVAQSELMDANVIAGWMMLNLALSQNGLRVVNGFADLLSPFLAVAGSHACATGWWSNLRTFTMGRYVKSERGGGQLPTIRYLSNRLMNRIKIDERYAYSQALPEIVNGLPLDREYDNGTPSRTVEAMQTWEALSSLNQDVVRDDIEESLTRLKRRIRRAKEAYDELRLENITDGFEAATEYLDQLDGAIDAFKKLAEL